MDAPSIAEAPPGKPPLPRISKLPFNFSKRLEIQQSNLDFLGDRVASSASSASTPSGIEIHWHSSDASDSEDESEALDIVGRLLSIDSDSEASYDSAHDSDDEGLEAEVYDKRGTRLTKIVREATSHFCRVTTDKLSSRVFTLSLRTADLLYEQIDRFFSKLREEIYLSISVIENRRKYDLRQSLLDFAESEEQSVRDTIEKRLFDDLDTNSTNSSASSVKRDDPDKLGPENVVADQRQHDDFEKPPGTDPNQRPEQIGGQEAHENGNIETSEGIGTKKKHRVWNHLTISRDQTAASDFAKELLLILRSSKLHRHIDEDENRHNDASAEHFISLASISHPHTTKAFLPYQVDGLRQQQPNGTLLEQQRLRLNLMRQKASANTHTHSSGYPLPNSAISSSYLHTDMDFNNTKVGLKTPSSSDLSQRVNADRNAIEDGPGDESSMGHLMGRIALLEAENNEFKEAQKDTARSETLYFIQIDARRNYATYLDEPTWAIGPRGEAVLKAHFPIHDISGYLNQKHDVAFVILKFYDWGQQGKIAQKAFRDKKALPRPQSSAQTIRLQSHDMIEAAEEFFAKQPKFLEEFPGFNIRGNLEAPYLFWYHYRSPEAFEGLSVIHKKMMTLLTSWIDENYGGLYARVESQLKRGVISAETMAFLVKPGDVLLWKEKRDTMAVIARSWPVSRTPPPLKSLDKKTDWRKSSNTTEDAPTWKWSVSAWQYDYDGSFFRKKRSMEIQMQSESFEEEIPIQKLTIYPLKYAGEDIKSTLEARGKTFWSCRFQRLVSYKDDRSVYGSGERFMIDFHTYEQLHSDSWSFKKSYPSIDDPECERMDASMMSSDEPPPVPEIYVFPKTIVGYNLRNKKWVDLEVDLIQDVSWNKKSFEHLVVDIETKDLVQALVTNQIEREQSTDIIDRKGNGLIILLHGGPGTGKTFTAESVAEMCEKPLFRVTCGDIGTKPEDVEKYLESVLHLGKSWGCVVLLDEADVFLEQRTLTDLERNALVSVFLRVLEYYEGILILTSNRVGTFDEAFKSRIQLSLHYENLTKGQRSKIWRNFLNRLKDLDGDLSRGLPRTNSGLQQRKPMDPTGIDFEDVECYLSDLAEFEMNGRQIRNAITTARQLAKFKDEPMSYHHLKHVITVSSKFDAYLKTVQEGFSDDQVARGDGIR